MIVLYCQCYKYENIIILFWKYEILTELPENHLTDKRKFLSSSIADFKVSVNVLILNLLAITPHYSRFRVYHLFERHPTIAAQFILCHR